MPSFVYRSFSGGEVAPSLYGRVDLVKYQTGLRICRNFVVARWGGVFNRPGTQFICEAKDSTKKLRLLKFVFNAEQTYVLIFGDQHMRVIQNGVQLTDSTKTISGATQANPVVITATAHGFSNGQEVAISGVVGMTELNGRNFKIAGVTANTFQLQDLSGANIDGTGFAAYVSGGSAKRIYEISTPYLEADLPTLQYTQSGDILTIVHPNYAPRELSRSDHTSWTLTVITFAPSINRPTGLSASGGPTGIARNHRYRVTAAKSETYEESLPGKAAAKIITGVTQANPAEVSVTSHGYVTGDEVDIDSIVGMTELNGRTFKITVTGVNTFTLNGEDSTGYGAYSSGGTSTRTHATVQTTAAGPSVANPITVTWTAVTGAAEYYIYKETNNNGIFGFIGTSSSTSFDDQGETPDLSDVPPLARNPFPSSGNFPSAVSYAQGRIVYANTDNDPEKVWMSRSEDFHNFTIRNPLQDDDSISFTLAGGNRGQVNEIRHVVEVGRPIILTAGGEWTLNGGADGIVRPGAINRRQHAYNGSHTVQPIIAGSNLLYIQARGGVVRDFRYQLETDGYAGNELSIFAPHLFEGYAIDDWDYQQIPHSVVWSVRSDGVLLGMTYIREHEIVGWHRHDTGASDDFERVVVVPEGDEDAVYLAVKRTINGATRRYVERFHSRQITAIATDAFFVDSGLTYDGRNTNTGHTMTLTGGSTWNYPESLTLTSSVSYFVSTDVGNAIILRSGSSFVICSITGFTSGTVVTVKPDRMVVVALRSTAVSNWGRMADELGGLNHLEGATISILADGHVEEQRTVTAGKITLSRPFEVIHVGLPITADIETLNLDLAQGPTLADRKKLVSKVTLFVEKSRGIFAGPDSDHLLEYKQRASEDYHEAIQPVTDTIEVLINSTWNTNGRVFVRQTDPLPISVLSIIPSGLIGD